MPKRHDIKKILIIGAGPIVIGQACEFDYSGTQGVRALKAEGYEIVLVNSNPATIMTDPEIADKTYIEPITPDVVAKIIEVERPDALLPTLGGQTALNTAVKLHEMGVLKKFNVELIGANIEAIQKAEDRQLFRDAMDRIGLKMPRSAIVNTFEEGVKAIKKIGFPVILRPAFTLGGTGGNISYSLEEFKEHLKWALSCSPNSQVLLDQSVLGWKEYELEVIRDKKDNVIIVCSIENFDPMGVHTGDSITVAPAQTLTDKEYQRLRNAAIDIIREIGVETGGSNVQFAVNPDNGDVLIVEMNPRVSRSSALASKATGFPIAKIAAKLAVGYTLDELKNDITRDTPASFEPSIDYVVTKIPRFTFEKFPGADDRLGTQMKSVGEVMAIGRTFKESLQKAMRSLELGYTGFDEVCFVQKTAAEKTKELAYHLKVAKGDRLWWVGQALREGWTVKKVFEHCKIDPWFLTQIQEIISFESQIKKFANALPKKLKTESDAVYLRKSEKLKSKTPKIKSEILWQAKQMGFSDKRLANLLNTTESCVSDLRTKLNFKAVYKTVDTCAAEFIAHTPYLYSTYESENESIPTNRKKVVILGGGPNRIGQGIEFDYCCCHASFSLRSEDYEVIMINCNPETVSTDYDTSDRLYFEPLTLEDVLRIIEIEKPLGVIVQFGGQTPLKLAAGLEKAGVKILGTSFDAIDRVEDRSRFSGFIAGLKLLQPQNGMAKNYDEAVKVARHIGYPVIVRPSYVLGGRAMEIIYDDASLSDYMTRVVSVSEDRPILVDKYLENAIEIDVDSLCDGKEAIVCGIMEHIEGAGIHSGDSACCLPPHSLSRQVVDEIARQTRLMATRLGVVGLMNVQFAICDDEIYVLEVNPRASRTIPFVSKAIGLPLAALAAKVMLGQTIKSLGLTERLWPSHKSVKESVFPFNKFPGVDTLLGPEMKSTGEVMGIDESFGMAFAKSQMAAGNHLPTKGRVFISVNNSDKGFIIPIAKELVDLGFEILATRGTAKVLQINKIECQTIKKHYEGDPNIIDCLKNKTVHLVINTQEGKLAAEDAKLMRRTALTSSTPYFTTIAAAAAAANAIKELVNNKISVKSLQEYHSVNEQEMLKRVV